MSLKTGAKLGPYEILGALGAGGMGEVYRARDERLSRDVAVKVLPPAVAGDPDRLRRFQLEARATGQLNHPNILAVYDTGEHEGSPYVVEELLEGETLRRRLDTSGALPARKAVEFGRQIARGLAAAHGKGIVHRDLKPENLFITGDGRVKILDFGLAKVTTPETTETVLTSAPTRVETGAGVVLGSVGYMAPEQVRGETVDARADLFSLGAILHEMLTGRRAFAADTAVETMNAILQSEPPDVSRIGQDLPGVLDAVVRRCLEKRPDERFQSASDLAFQLQEVFATDSLSGARPAALSRPRRRVPAPLLAAAALVAAVALAGGSFLAGRGSRPDAPSPPEYRQLTFRQGTIFSARFNPGGATAVFSAAWEGRPRELLTTGVSVPGPRSLGLDNAEILSVSTTGELAVLLEPTYTSGWMRKGTLARLPASGGVPREVLEGVQDATWGPEGESLAVVREVDIRHRLEYPVGTILAETTGWYSSPRFSRDGRWIAVIHHPGRSDNRGQVALVDLQGGIRMLTEPFSSADGLAWSAEGTEIWFSAGRTGNVAAIYGVDFAGSLRMVDGAPTDLTLLDIASDGTVLLSRNLARRGIVAKAREGKERDLSYMDWSRPADISRDGRWVLFDEQGQGGGPDYTLFLRGTDGSPPVQLGKGGASSLSADGRWALSYSVSEPKQLSLVPVGAGERRPIEVPGMRFAYGALFPGGERLLLQGQEGERPARLWEVTLEDGQVRPVSPEGVDFPYFISGDGRFVLATGIDGRPWRFSVDGDEPRPVPGGQASDEPAGLSEDGRLAYVAVRGLTPRPVERIDMDTGERTPWRDLLPANMAGLLNVDYVRLTPDARAYVYSYRRVLSTLYVVEGLR